MTSRSERSSASTVLQHLCSAVESQDMFDSAAVCRQYGAVVLHLLVDTSIWLDLAKKRDGQKLIHSIGQVYRTATWSS